MHDSSDLHEGEATGLHHYRGRRVPARRHGALEESSRSRSDERESGTYVLFKYFCHSIIVVLVRLVSKTTIQVV